MKATIFISCVLGHLWDKWDIRQRKGVTGHKGANIQTPHKGLKGLSGEPATNPPPASYIGALI